jgi:hypothetical protein
MKSEDFGHMVKHLAIVLALLAASTAQAGFESAFTGNSQTVFDEDGVTRGTSDGLINFAVYKNQGGATGNWITDLGLTGLVSATTTSDLPGTSGREEYVYFYQLVNTNPAGSVAGDSGLHLLQIQSGPGDFLAGGYVSGSGFNSATPGLAGATGVTGPTSNPSIGPPTTDGTVGNDPVNGTPGFSGGTLGGTGFLPVVGAVTPNSLRFVTGDIHGQELEFWQFSWDAGFPLGGYSTVVFLTSNSRPQYLRGIVHDGSTTDGDIPSTTPEPATFVSMLGVLATGLVAWGARGRRS